MGLFGRKIKNPVRGTAHVASCSAPPDRASSAMCRMNLVITIPDHPSVPVDGTWAVSLKKWPTPGFSLPVEADRDDPTRFRFLWDEVPTGLERGAQAAEQYAARLNQPQAAPTPTDGGFAGFGLPLAGTGDGVPTFRSTSVSINGRAATPEEIASFEALTGMDLNGDGVVGGTPQATDPRATPPQAAPRTGGGSAANPADAEDDRVATLERLAALHDSGALTDAEFAAEKRRILRS